MSWVQNILTIGLVSFGVLLMLTGSIGILRLPDFFTRTHATSKVDTVGVIVVLLGLAVHEGWTMNSAKLLVGMAFVALANPVAVHALARAALNVGIKPWTADGSSESERSYHELDT